MIRHRIREDASAVVIEVSGVGEQQDELLAAFEECQSGSCSCPTDEYEKVASMEVEPGDEQITLRLQAKPGTAFDSSQIAVCLDHTVAKVARD